MAGFGIDHLSDANGAFFGFGGEGVVDQETLEPSFGLPGRIVFGVVGLDVLDLRIHRIHPLPLVGAHLGLEGVEHIFGFHGHQADVEVGGISRRVSIWLTPEVKIGDYVLLHTGYAINIIDEVEAAETFKLLEELVSQNE